MGWLHAAGRLEKRLGVEAPETNHGDERMSSGTRRIRGTKVVSFFWKEESSHEADG
jgi:hypothetical protein